MFNDSDIKEFQEIYFNDTGQRLTFEQARKEFEESMELFREIYRLKYGD